MTETRTQRLVWGAFVAALAGVALFAAWHWFLSAEPALPVLGTVPSFTLVERSGTPLTAERLTGKVWVASFIFTRCGGMCPAISTNVAGLLRRWQEGGGAPFTAVSFSVDPENDDPATLRAYAQQYGAGAFRWLFATGERPAVEALVRDGFHLAIAALPPGERESSPEPITHSDRLVLVDPELHIRGYYHATDPDGLAQLEHDLTRLTHTHT